MVRALSPDSAVVAVGGVGLQVLCSPGTLARLRIGETATLATALVVREDSLTLYGFVDADERSVFESLQTATGVGPRLAQSVLGVLAPDDIRRAVAEEDLAALCRVPGVGRKVAQRLVLELRDRLGAPEGPTPRAAATTGGPQDEVRSGLVGLGYSMREADEALAAVGTASGPAAGEKDTAALLRAALAVLRRT